MLALHQTGRVMRITLNRPEKRNALSLELSRRIADAVESAAGDPTVGAILLLGAGKSFCAGMDLNEMGQVDPDELAQVHERLFTLGANLLKPLIMAIHGAALAGGTGLAANAHIAYAAEDATFGLTEIRLGLWPFIVYRSIEAAVGHRRALELSLTGRIFPAAEAEEYGLVHRVFPTPELLPAAEAMAEGIANFSPTAIAAGLEYVKSSRQGENAGVIARDRRRATLASPDFHEGVKAFFEKRTPKWPSLST